MKLLVPVVIAGMTACASGGRDTIDGNTHDSSLVDGVVVDAPPGAQTLTQTTSQTIEAGTSIACMNNPPGTNANNYYRVFDLAALGITSDFHVTRVSFQVEHCDQITGTAGAVVAVRVGTYAGTPGAQLEASQMTILASNATVAVPEVIEDLGPPPTTPGATVDAPITATIPAGQKLLVEVDAPDGHNQYYFYMGATTQAESAFGYVLAPTCKDMNGVLITKPTNISALYTMYPAVHLLLTVTGQSGS